MTPASVVHAWLAAVNAGDAERVLALSAPDVRMVGPRGTAAGHDVLRGWLAHAGAAFETRATFARGGAVVVFQRVVWSGPPPATAEVATRFLVAGGFVAELQRYPDPEAALRAAALTAADQLPAPS